MELKDALKYIVINKGKDVFCKRKQQNNKNDYKRLCNHRQYPFSCLIHFLPQDTVSIANTGIRT